jgi:hypothetical protein
MLPELVIVAVHPRRMMPWQLASTHRGAPARRPPEEMPVLNRPSSCCRS